MRPVLVVGLAVAGVLSGCSSAGSSPGQPHPQAPQLTPPTVATSSSPVQLRAVRCPASPRNGFSPGGTARAVTVQADVTAGFSTCNYRSQAGEPDACSAATVTIDTNPQAFKDFQRWVLETTQNAGAGPGEELSPEQIDGIGIEADWVPGTLTFETATDSRWVAIRLTCARSGPQDVTLAEALARAALTAG